MAEQSKQAPAKQASAPSKRTSVLPATAPGSPGVPRWRRVVSATLLVVGCVLVPVCLSAVWVRNTLLDTDNYVATVGPLASNAEIQQALADDIAAGIFVRVDVEKKVAEALPTKGDFLAAPIAGALNTLTNKAALQLLESDRFQTLWENANRRAHGLVEKALTGGGPRVSTKDGDVALDLKEVFGEVRQKLDAKGITIFDRVELPQKYQQFVLFQSNDLAQAQGGVDLLQTLAWVLPFILIASFAGAVALSSTRRRTILRAGIAVALVVGLQLVLLKAGRNFYLDAITSKQLPRGAAGAAWDQLTSFLRLSGTTMIVLALLIAIAAWVPGRSRMAGRVRGVWQDALAGAGAKADDSGVATGSVAAFVARSKAPLRLAGVGIAILILIAWNHPKPGTVLGVGLLLLVYLGAVEFLGRAAPDRVEATDRH